jgi:hypothetical protein
MNWDNFKTYNGAYTDAFETLNNQLFERYVRREYPTSIVKFRVVNGSGGDGGIEAYAELLNGDITAVQSKWFRTSLQDPEIRQIKNSILTAKGIRPQLKKYVICIPHDVNSVKIGRGKVPTTNDEENKINALIDEIHVKHTDLELIWWFDNELLSEIQKPENEGVHKYWFEREVITLSSLKEKFALQRQNLWLKERYIPEINSKGYIFAKYEQLVFSVGFREMLSEDTDQCINKIKRCHDLIEKYLSLDALAEEIKNGLTSILDKLSTFVSQLQNIKEALITGNSLYQVRNQELIDIHPIVIKFQEIIPSHKQKPYHKKLISSIEEIQSLYSMDTLHDIVRNFNHSIRLIYGGAGTGKTQGLAFCLDTHLAQDLPGLIIAAKGTPCRNWTEILSCGLELNGWNKDEILSALESAAHNKDVASAKTSAVGSEIKKEPASVLICVDGLDEDIDNQQEWCSRISESFLLITKYPRIKFLFSARDYFRKNCIDASNSLYKEVYLSREGDVPLSKVLSAYLKHYSIELSEPNLIKGLDSLLGLRLFCETYSNRKIVAGEHIMTATKDLLNLKVRKINEEFLATLQQRKGETQEPVLDALIVIAECFYHNLKIEHNVLRTLLNKALETILEPREIDLLLDFLVRHGILIRDTDVDSTSLIVKTKHFYLITYQSIIEHILSERIYNDIKDLKVEEIPDILQYGIIDPTTDGAVANSSAPNERVIQPLVNRLFIEKEKLIGDNGFLAKGLPPQTVAYLRFEALRTAPYEKAIKYKNEVDQLFHGGPQTQYTVLKELIIPSAHNSKSAFGSTYLHEILSNLPSAFERDKLWSGLDNFEQKTEESRLFSNNLNSIINNGRLFPIPEFEDYNETPLLYTWGLTNISQALRHEIRIELTLWASKRPDEFTKLLDKIFFVNDPQIQEDLATVALGLASILNEQEKIKVIAEWALVNVFKDKLLHRNIIVRQGFRAIVEKANLLGVISETNANASRPSQLSQVVLMDLHFDESHNTGSEIYPITHDLAWYVIKKAYHNFLEYPESNDKGVKDRDCDEAKSLLNRYRAKYEDETLFANSWAMAAAIGYIRKTLGLSREKGNGFTDATHGAKSKIFTFEEKYTWLAVHYIQGYLSDYIPLNTGVSNREWIQERKWINDYSKIVAISNPAEEIISEEDYSEEIDHEDTWVIKENLSNNINLTGDINHNIETWVREEPVIDFSKWIEYQDNDFFEKGDSKKLVILSNLTSLSDATDAGISRITIRACVAKTDDFEILKKIISSASDQLHFLMDIGRLETTPDTDTYSNPSDIVWMQWIGEYDPSEKINIGDDTEKELEVFYSITSITQETLAGENFFSIPSKLIRGLIGIVSYNNSEFYNSENERIGFIHSIKDDSITDRQEMTLVDYESLSKSLDEKGLGLFWFVDHFKTKNAHNISYKQYNHALRTRKYLVWKSGESFQSIKFWDEKFSNQRDK